MHDRGRTKTTAHNGTSQTAEPTVAMHQQSSPNRVQVNELPTT